MTDSMLQETLSATMLATGWDADRVLGFVVKFLSDKEETVSELISELNKAILEETRPIDDDGLLVDDPYAYIDELDETI